MRSIKKSALYATGAILVFALPFLGTAAMVLAGCVSVLSLIFTPLRHRRTSLLVLWLLIVLATPPWISLQLAGYRVPVAAIASFAVIVVSFGYVSVRWILADSLALLLAITCILASTISTSPLHLATQALFEWIACYAAGRFLLHDVNYPLVANRVAGLVGWAAVSQAVFQYNLSQVWPFSYSTAGSPWVTLQERGGQIRAELTMGHSIALGAVLTILLPFALKQNKTLSDRVLLVGIFCGVLATFSRSSMMAAFIAVAITVLVSNIDAVKKGAAIFGCALSAWIAVLVFGDVVNSASNSAELTDSTAYREGLLDLTQLIRLFGVADDAVPAPDGVTYTWGRFYSVDNGLLYVGLYLGLVAVVLYVSWIVSAFRNSTLVGWSPFSTVIVAQIPFILTVAPITQYQNVFWLIAGAGAAIARRRTTPVLVERLGYALDRSVDLSKRDICEEAIVKGRS